mmetsp:Transcript_34047/g.90714  ORF Transcript_34047/g.90714 Transcript_34047/m.90714 type:complete len:400 (-) Transcript_34047:75-1274(-)
MYRRCRVLRAALTRPLAHTWTFIMVCPRLITHLWPAVPLAAQLATSKRSWLHWMHLCDAHLFGCGFPGIDDDQAVVYHGAQGEHYKPKELKGTEGVPPHGQLYRPDEHRPGHVNGRSRRGRSMLGHRHTREIEERNRENGPDSGTQKRRRVTQLIDGDRRLLDAEEVQNRQKDHPEDHAKGALHAYDHKGWHRVLAQDIFFVDQHRCLEHLGGDAQADAQQFCLQRRTRGRRGHAQQTAKRHKRDANEDQGNASEVVPMLLVPEEHDTEQAGENDDSTTRHLHHRCSYQDVGHVHQSRRYPIERTCHCKDVLRNVLRVHGGVAAHPVSNQTQELTYHHEHALEIRVVEDVCCGARPGGHCLDHHEFHEQRVQRSTDEHDEHEEQNVGWQAPRGSIKCGH